MGLRSWLTRVDSEKDVKLVKKYVEANPYAFGTDYWIKATKDAGILSNGIWVAWSGDGNISLNEYMPSFIAEETLFLDDVTDELPEYNEDPHRYGELRPL